MTREYSAVRWVSANENGYEEVIFEYPKTFFQSLFKRPNDKEVYVRIAGCWRNKQTGKLASVEKVEEINSTVFYTDDFSISIKHSEVLKNLKKYNIENKG